MTVACDFVEVFPAIGAALIALCVATVVLCPAWGVWQCSRRSKRRQAAAYQLAAVNQGPTAAHWVPDSGAAEVGAVVGLPVAGVAEQTAPVANATQQSV